MSVPRVVIDLEKSKNPCSGLGQFSLNLGQTLIPAAEAEGLNPVPLLARGSDDLFPGREVLGWRWWQKERFQRLYRWGVPSGCYGDVELWHATHQQVRFLPLDPKVPVVLTIHDLNYLREKEGTKVDRDHHRIQVLIDRATAITTISEFVAAEIRDHFQLRGKPLRVIYNGGPKQAETRPERPSWLAPEAKFLFTIGIIDRKKNFHVLLDLIRNLPEHHLVIAGENTNVYAKEIGQEIERLDLTHRVHLPGMIDDAERQWCYQQCEALVFPSLTEGFGLPPIEAMAVGKPVFLARRTSLPEIGGDVAFYWDDFEADHLLEVFEAGMRKFQSDPQYPARLQAQAARYCWNKAARAYVEVYRDILSANETGRRELARAA